MSKFFKVMTMAFVLLAVMVVCEGMMAMKVDESYIEHKVECGETMRGIASEYYHLTDTGMCFEEYLWNLRQINNKLQPANGAGLPGTRMLQPGDVVKVPAWKKIEK